MTDRRQQLRLERVAIIVDLLAREPLPIAVLTARVNRIMRQRRQPLVVRRTLELDLAWVRKHLGTDMVERLPPSRLESAPPPAMAKHRSFYRLRGDQLIIPVGQPLTSITESEAIALGVARALLRTAVASPDGTDEGPLSSAIACLMRRLGLSGRSTEPGWPVPDLIEVLSSPLQPYDPNTLLLVMRALRTGRGLQGRYQPKQRQAHPIHVQPARLTLVDGAPSLWAWDGGDQMIKQYELSRLRQVQLAAPVDNAPAGLTAAVKGRLIGAFAGSSRGRGLRVVIRCTSALTPLLRERTLGRAQRITELPDGGLRIAFNTNGSEAVVRWVLSFGAMIRVEEPADLRKSVHAELQRSLVSYEE